MFQRQLVLFTFAALLPLLETSGNAQTTTANATASGISTNAAIASRVFPARGVVQELPPGGRSVVIQHEAVTNYMPAMTMSFDVRETNELRGLQPGDSVAFQIIVSNADAWIENLVKINPRPAKAPSARPAFRPVRDVDPLKTGDLLPEYHFTNELGRALSTREFAGQGWAFTFFFTRCPYPTFCPLLSANFEAVQKKLLATTNGPANWHLLSISFDTEADSPATLKLYAEGFGQDPAHWSFVTGDLVEITALGDQFGEYFGHDESGGVTHNLRTVVVDARGRVHRIFTDNKWTADELTSEILQAAAVK